MNIAVKPDAADRRRRSLDACRSPSSTRPGPTASRTTPSGRCSSGCAARTRFTSRRRASSAPTGRSPTGTTSWRWTPTMRRSPRPTASACRTSKPMAEQARPCRRWARAARARRRRLHHHGRARPRPGAARRSARPLAPANIAKMAPVVRERAGEILDSLPDRRGVRLGRPGVEGADGDDPGHPVRLPVRAAPQAALVVGHVHEPARPRPGGELAAERRGDLRVLQRLQRAVERAGQRRARHRPDLDAGAQPGTRAT